MQEQEAVKGSRGKAHIVVKCKLCFRENTLRKCSCITHCVYIVLSSLYRSYWLISPEILEDSIKPYSVCD